MSEVLEQAPARDCYGCGQTDTAPRFTHIVDMADPSKDELYHYDCIPAGVVKHHGLDSKDHPSHAIRAACLKGRKDDELRAFAAKHAASIAEAPADDPKD
jgi:hypothetical protein